MAGPTPSGGRYEIRSAGGSCAVVGAFGARLIEMHVPDRDGAYGDVSLGFDDDEAYRRHAAMYIGATVGRVAGRIARARFELDGRVVALAANEPPNHLHGGRDRSFDRVVWDAERTTIDGIPGVRLAYATPDLEEGYPGRVEATAHYQLDGNDLRLTYEATTDRRTPIAMTSHAYWNLAGAGALTILDHELRVPASSVSLTDDGLVPTGEVAPVEGGPLDFRRAHQIGERIDALVGGPAEGYDHNLLLDDPSGDLRPVAWLRDPSSGRTMEVLSTEEAVQFYAGNRMTTVAGKGATTYGLRSGLCLEPQATPDAVNRPAGRSIILEPGQRYRHEIVFRFGVDR
jgi:aldose 1-epimerase